MFFLTLLLSSILSGTDTLAVQEPATPLDSVRVDTPTKQEPVKTLDLSGTVIVNADYANQAVSSINRSEVSAVDTLDTADEFVKLLLYGDRTWRYIKIGGDKQYPEVFNKHWETTSVNPYQKPVEKLPDAWSIWLVDSLSQFHCPYKGSIWPGGKYGPRKNRRHQGVDLPLAVGTPIYATFPGKVRVSRYSESGYGHYVVIRHENGLETFYAHLSEKNVAVGDWVNAGQVIGLGGSTGRSTGPHLHYEVRYQGFSFDPEWIIDFKKGSLRQRLFILKKKYFGVNHADPQNFEDEMPEEKKEEATKAVATKSTATTSAKPSTTTKPSSGAVYHVIVSGDTLYALAVRNNTSVAAICRLNNITENTVLQLGQKLRIK